MVCEQLAHTLPVGEKGLVLLIENGWYSSDSCSLCPFRGNRLMLLARQAICRESSLLVPSSCFRELLTHLAIQFKYSP